ncbi:MAG: hypothetical protein ABFC77_00070 [Thermoguttaceae bacterium]
MCECKTKTQALASIGFLCEQTKRGYFDALKALDEAGVKPVYLLDLVPYYDWNRASQALDPNTNPPMIEGASHAE